KKKSWISSVFLPTGYGARPMTRANREGDHAGPRRVAVIMDGNGRWACQNGRPRHAGHRAGVRAARAVVEACAEAGVGTLTLFAFSSENWKRPAQEVDGLMRLFVEVLQREVDALHESDIQL